MKRILCIFSLFSCICCLSHAVNNESIEMQDHSSFIQERQPNFHITSSNRNINISGLNPNSYLMVFDASGRNVFKGNTSNNISIPVRGKGVFIIRVQNGKEVFTQKVLVP